MPLQRQLLGAAVQLLRAEQQISGIPSLGLCLRQVPLRRQAAESPLGARLFASAQQTLTAAPAGWTAAAGITPVCTSQHACHFAQLMLAMRNHHSRDE